MVIGPSQTRPSSANGISDILKPATTIKFLCSHGGKILPRYPDGKLRYHGGETRVLSVNRLVSFADLLLKVRDLCGTDVFIRCQLPKEDLDSLVSITSDEDLANLIEEYDRASSSSSSPEALPQSLKIRAFLSPPKPAKQGTSPSRASLSSSNSASPTALPLRFPAHAVGPAQCLPHHQLLKLRMIAKKKPNEWKVPMPYYSHGAGYYAGDSHSSRTYLIHNGNHWQ